jgi:hypothetical protein
MQSHVGNVRTMLPGSGPLAPSKSHQGVRANIDQHSFFGEHVRRCKEAKTDREAYKGVKPHVGPDNFATTQMKELKESTVKSERYSSKKLRPHVGADAKIMEFYRAEKEKKTSFNRARSPHQGMQTKLGADAYQIAQLRSTKAQAEARAYQGVKPSMTVDTFHANFLKSAEKSWPSRKPTREVRL